MVQSSAQFSEGIALGLTSLTGPAGNAQLVWSTSHQAHALCQRLFAVPTRPKGVRNQAETAVVREAILGRDN